MLKKLTSVVVVTVALILPHVAQAKLTLQISPFSTAPTGYGALGLNLGVESDRSESFVFNYLTVGMMAEWQGGGDPHTALSSAVFYKVVSNGFVGARIGMISPESQDDFVGFGALAFRHMRPDSSWIYEANLGIAGAGAEFAQFSFGWRFF